MEKKERNTSTLGRIPGCIPSYHTRLVFIDSLFTAFHHFLDRTTTALFCRMVHLRLSPYKEPTATDDAKPCMRLMLQNLVQRWMDNFVDWFLVFNTLKLHLGYEAQPNGWLWINWDHTQLFLFFSAMKNNRCSRDLNSQSCAQQRQDLLWLVCFYTKWDRCSNRVGRYNLVISNHFWALDTHFIAVWYRIEPAIVWAEVKMFESPRGWGGTGFYGNDSLIRVQIVLWSFLEKPQTKSN